MLRSRSVFPFASPLSAQAESLETTLLDGSLASARPASTDIHRRGDRGMFANLKTLSKRTLKATSLTITYPFYGTTKTRPTRAKPKPEANGSTWEGSTQLSGIGTPNTSVATQLMAPSSPSART